MYQGQGTRLWNWQSPAAIAYSTGSPIIAAM
jgi:hypothetical protein